MLLDEQGNVYSCPGGCSTVPAGPAVLPILLAIAALVRRQRSSGAPGVEPPPPP